jgi:hypothetical protein
MDLVNHYLTRDKSTGIYYVRLNIPGDLHPYFSIKTLKRSLKTRDKLNAGINCLQFIQHFKQEFDRGWCQERLTTFLAALGSHIR